MYLIIKEQGWKFTDGTPVNFTLFEDEVQLWANGEPNAPFRKNCVFQYPWEKWGDAECDSEDDQYPFFCGPLGKIFKKKRFF